MEITMPHLNESLPADFTNRAAGNVTFSPMITIAGMLIGLFTGPGLTSASPSSRQWELPDLREASTHAQSSAEASVVFIPAAELITQIRQGWQFNMTELSDILGVTRPTVYSWLNGKTSPDAEKIQRLQVISAAARIWTEQTVGKDWDYMLDYSGPQANEATLRDHLKSSGTTVAQLRELIPVRIAQYQQAYAEARKLLGDPPPTPKIRIPEGTRRLNRLWAENAEKLHRFRNS